MILLKYIIFDKVIVSSCRESGFLARLYMWRSLQGLFKAKNRHKIHVHFLNGKTDTNVLAAFASFYISDLTLIRQKRFASGNFLCWTQTSTMTNQL